LRNKGTVYEMNDFMTNINSIQHLMSQTSSSKIENRRKQETEEELNDDKINQEMKRKNGSTNKKTDKKRRYGEEEKRTELNIGMLGPSSLAPIKRKGGAFTQSNRFSQNEGNSTIPTSETKNASFLMLDDPSVIKRKKGGMMNVEKRFYSDGETHITNPGPKYDILETIELERSQLPSTSFSKKQSRFNSSSSSSYSFQTPAPDRYQDTLYWKQMYKKMEESKIHTQKVELQESSRLKNNLEEKMPQIFGFGCKLEEHIVYGKCLDGKCGTRAPWEEMAIEYENFERIEGVSKGLFSQIEGMRNEVKKIGRDKRKKGRQKLKDRELIFKELNEIKIAASSKQATGGEEDLNKNEEEEEDEEIKVEIETEEEEEEEEEDTGPSPLLVAATRGDLKVIHILCCQGKWDINVKDEMGSTPLHIGFIFNSIIFGGNLISSFFCVFVFSK